MRFVTVALLMTAMTHASPQAQVTMVTDSLGFPTLSAIGGGAPAATTPPTQVVAPEASRTSTAVLPPSPTGQGVCVAHVDHWDCEGGSHEGHDHSEEGHSHDGDSHEGHSHAGHSHGPSEEYGCGLAPVSTWDKDLHIAAVFILLIAALSGTVLPLLLGSRTSHQGRGFVANAFFAIKHFGSGIILSTAFVHLLYHAYIYFANECIGELAYEPAAPAIAMGAVWFVFVLDFFLLRTLRTRSSNLAAQSAIINGGERDLESKNSHASDEDVTRNVVDDRASIDAATAALRKWDVVALEAGIIFHSILIGITLGASSGDGWIPLLIAITFHQLFEGLALGSRIALLPQASADWLQKGIMCAAYSLTTPVGIAIGMGVRESFNTNGRGTLLALGILDSISAGILLYTALVELLAGDFINNSSMCKASLGRCITAVASLTLGGAAMSVLAVWA